MSYKVLLCPRAQRQLRGIATRDKDRLKAAILGLANDPRPSDAVAMQEVQSAYRLRVGDYRVVYTVHEGTVTVLVLQVGHRRDVYRKGDIDSMNRDARQWLADQSDSEDR